MPKNTRSVYIFSQLLVRWKGETARAARQSSGCEAGPTPGAKKRKQGALGRQSLSPQHSSGKFWAGQWKSLESAANERGPSSCRSRLSPRHGLGAAGRKDAGDPDLGALGCREKANSGSMLETLSFDLLFIAFIIIILQAWMTLPRWTVN